MELLVAGKETVAALSRRIALARELGHKEIVLLFPKAEKGQQALVTALQEPSLRCAAFAKTQQEAAKARRLYSLVFAPATREMFESKHVTHILEPETGSRPDFIHHRNSGLNQVLLALCTATAKRPGKEIVATLHSLLAARQQAVVLGRMLQNARFCRKYKVPYHVTSGASVAWEQRDAEGLKALGRVLKNKP